MSNVITSNDLNNVESSKKKNMCGKSSTGSSMCLSDHRSMANSFLPELASKARSIQIIRRSPIYYRQ